MWDRANGIPKHTIDAKLMCALKSCIFLLHFVSTMLPAAAAAAAAAAGQAY